MTQDGSVHTEEARSETLYQSSTTRVARVVVAGSTGSRIVKQSVGAGAVERLRLERTVLERLVGVPGVLTPVTGDAANAPECLVFEDPDCTALANLLASRSLDANEVLRLALALARILSGVHRRGVIHKDINPANIIVGRGPLEVFLIDFDIAGLFDDGRTALSAPGELSGTLPYMAPEQTGRNARALDRRADLYSLGATLYAALTGEPPFGTVDPLQIIHDHLARIPIAPLMLDSRVPPNLSRIIMRLLEKEPDDRYQSAEGLLFDLERAQELGLNGDPAELTLGERDFAPRLRSASRLVGRDAELSTLRTYVDELQFGTRTTVLVSGSPGVGKSVLLDEVRDWVTTAGGHCLATRFDPFKQVDESDAIRRVVQGLLRLLLAEPEAELVGLRDRVRRELGPNIPLAVAVLPEVAHLLNVTTPSDVSDSLSVAARLQHISLQLLRSIATPTRPVVLVIEDLQWASATALEMLDAIHLDPDLNGVLVLGSYRPNELGATHPLCTLIDRWRRFDAAPRELPLRNLEAEAISMLLGESLRLPMRQADALARDLLPLSLGNPFDTLELVDALRRDDILRLEPAGWHWDAARIHSYLEGRNVDALVAARLEGLPVSTANLLGTMSCLGGVVPIARLAVASNMTPAQVDQPLQRALSDGLLIMDVAGEAVQFRHDRIHQAVMARHDIAASSSTLLTVARRLAAAPEHASFAAEPYLQVADRLEDAGEIVKVIGLFRPATMDGRLNGNWQKTERYALAALTLLARIPHPAADARAMLELELRLATDRHAALYTLGRLHEADEIYDAIVARSPEPLCSAEATWTQISSLTQRDRQQDSVALALRLLGALGLTAPVTAAALCATNDAGMAQLYSWLQETTEADDLGRPEYADPYVTAIARTINHSIPPAYLCEHPAMPWLIMQAGRLWREHGPCAALVGPLSHAAFMTIKLREDYRGGHDIVRRVVNVATQRHYDIDAAQARFTYALSCVHWSHPLERGIVEGRAAHEVLNRGGEVYFASTVYLSLLLNLLECAPSLEELEREATVAVKYCERIGNNQGGAAFLAYRQFARSLRGSTNGVGQYSDSSFDETSFVAHTASNPAGTANYRVTRALSALLAGDFKLFAEQMEVAVLFLPMIHSIYLMAVLQMLRCLDLAHRARQASPAGRSALLAELDGVRDWMALRAIDCPHNFQHLLHWIDAERAWVVDDFRTAAIAFDAAHRVASTRCRPWHRALILEQTSRLYRAVGISSTADALLQRARVEYDAWGADGKTATIAPAQQNDSAPPDGRTLRDPLTSAGSHRGGSLRGQETDLLAILEAAQQLQTETDPDRLVDSVSTVLSALSGATSVRLALWSEDLKDWFVSAKDEGGARREVPIARAIAESMLPSSAFRYTQRTREPLIVDDALGDDRFARDPYFYGLQRCSLLVVPVMSRGVLKAMLVLENRVAQAVFAGQRLDGVMLIAGQLATSLDNAQLSVSIERRVAQRVQHLDEDNERLERLSNTDPLTGLANRRLMDATLQTMLEVAAHSSEPLAAAMIDIDHFKLFNDRYGHQAGDECLENVAAAIRECARASDLVARFGGEEFVLLLPSTDLESALAILERVRANVAARAYAHERSPYGIVTLSIGVASFVPTGAEDGERLLSAADQHLYAAKQHDRNCVMPTPAAPLCDIGA